MCLKEVKEKDGGMTDGKEEEAWAEEDEREERKNWGLMGGAERVCTHHVCWAGGGRGWRRLGGGEGGWQGVKHSNGI